MSGSGDFTLLDGAMGTELARRGHDTGLPLWSANALLNAPEAVCCIHADYLRAGAHVITTNTFRANTRMLLRAGLYDRAGELVHLAVDLAREAINVTQTKAHIAGSIAPVEDCYSPELVPQDAEVLLREHGELAMLLAESGCDLLLIETMNTLREATAAAQAANATGLPFWVSFMLDAHNALLSGESLLDAIDAVLPHQPQAILVNCIPVVKVESALQLLREYVPSGFHIGAYANAGHVRDHAWSMENGVSPHEYAQAARTWREIGATIIGGCCGTTPNHIQALRDALR